MCFLSIQSFVSSLFCIENGAAFEICVQTFSVTVLCSYPLVFPPLCSSVEFCHLLEQGFTLREGMRLLSLKDIPFVPLGQVSLKSDHPSTV